MASVERGPTARATRSSRAYAEGEDADPWGDEALPVPGRFTEAGEPPLVVVTGPAPTGGIRVAEGQARICYVRDVGTFTAVLYDRSAHHGQPLVSVVRRADGAPHVTVVGGKVRVLYYDEEAAAPARIEPISSDPAGIESPAPAPAARRGEPGDERAGGPGREGVPPAVPPSPRRDPVAAGRPFRLPTREEAPHARHPHRGAPPPRPPA